MSLILELGGYLQITVNPLLSPPLSNKPPPSNKPPFSGEES